MTTVSQSASYAFRALSWLEGPEGDYRSAVDLAELSGTPGPYLAKLFQVLHKARIVDAVRGRRGGFKLARAAADIPLCEVVDQLDGEGWRSACLLGLWACLGHPACAARFCCKDVRLQVVTELTRLTVQDLVDIRRELGQPRDQPVTASWPWPERPGRPAPLSGPPSPSPG